MTPIGGGLNIKILFFSSASFHSAKALAPKYSRNWLKQPAGWVISMWGRSAVARDDGDMGGARGA